MISFPVCGDVAEGWLGEERRGCSEAGMSGIGGVGSPGWALAWGAGVTQELWERLLLVVERWQEAQLVLRSQDHSQYLAAANPAAMNIHLPDIHVKADCYFT